MLETFLADLEALRNDLADVPAQRLAVMHLVNTGGAWLKVGGGDRNVYLFKTDAPAPRERAIASVPIAEDAPGPAWAWSSVITVYGDLTPGSACAFEIDGRVIYPVGPLRPSVVGRRWRPRPL